MPRRNRTVEVDNRATRLLSPNLLAKMHQFKLRQSPAEFVALVDALIGAIVRSRPDRPPRPGRR